MRGDLSRMQISIRHLVPLTCLALLAVGCGGNTSEQAPRLAVQLPRGASGPLDSPAIQAAFTIQYALNTPATQSTMEAYLGDRYADDWIVNNGTRGVLYVGVVHLASADQRYAQSHIHMGLHASFRLVDEKYSFAQLKAFQAVVSRYVAPHTKGKLLLQHPFTNIDVSPNNNAVDFGVPKNEEAYWIRRIQPLLPYDALVVHYGSPPIAN